jgi:8-oxo-dGTP pyrophosphatase MutT (NUDIX family)
MENKRTKNSAGFIVFRNFYDGYKVLVLYKRNGSIDLPKGRMDKSDKNLLATAKRETFEECGIIINDKDIISKGKEFNNLTFFVAITDMDGFIRPNPETGIIEHQSISWINPFTAFMDAPDYLCNAIKWGMNHLKEYLRSK